MFVRLLALILLLIALPGVTAIYKEVDQDGKTSYSDKPTTKQEKALNLPPVNTQPALKITPRPRTTDKPRAAAISYQIYITSPTAGTYVSPGQRVLEVAVQLEPSLQPGHRLQAFINGTAFGPALAETHLLLAELYRGEHQLSVAVIDSDSNPVATSSTITIYVQRPSVAK